MPLSLNSRPRFLSLAYLLLTVCMLLFNATDLGFHWGWSALSLLIILLFMNMDDKVNTTPLFMAFVIYALIVLGNIYFINPVFHAEGLFFIAILFFSFLFGRSLSREQALDFFRITVCIFTLLAVWGIYQHLTESAQIVAAGNRANTVYYTPNSFAAAINLLLIPLIIIRLCSNSRRIMDIVIFLLFLALMATQSRGGWIAFAAGGLTGIGILMSIGHFKLHKSNSVFLSKLGIIALIFFTYQNINTGTIFSEPGSGQMTDVAKVEESAAKKDVNRLSTFEHRLLFYQIAWDQFLKKPALGNGYFNFQYFLERDKTPEITKLGVSNFVHNDYLQHLVEVGLVGTSALLLLIAVFYYQAWICIRNSNSEAKLLFIAVVASGTAFFVHASGDFVIYIPGLTLFLGLMLGFFDRAGYGNTVIGRSGKLSGVGLKNFNWFKPVVSFCLIVYFATPVLAKEMGEIAKNYEEKREYTNAQKYYQYARRLAPYEATYYYHEAKLWIKAVVQQQSQQAADIADGLLLSGINKNPYEKDNRLLRAILHRDHTRLLSNAESIDTILDWHEEILVWQPGDRASELEYIKSLSKAGREQEARQRYQAFQQKLLEDNKLKNLLSRALNPDK